MILFSATPPSLPCQGHPEAATNLGYILLRKREFAAAIEQFSAAIDHGSAAAMYHMGQVRACECVRGGQCLFALALFYNRSISFGYLVLFLLPFISHSPSSFTSPHLIFCDSFFLFYSFSFLSLHKSHL